MFIQNLITKDWICKSQITMCDLPLYVEFNKKLDLIPGNTLLYGKRFLKSNRVKCSHIQNDLIRIHNGLVEVALHAKIVVIRDDKRYPCTSTEDERYSFYAWFGDIIELIPGNPHSQIQIVP